MAAAIPPSNNSFPAPAGFNRPMPPVATPMAPPVMPMAPMSVGMSPAASPAMPVAYPGFQAPNFQPNVAYVPIVRTLMPPQGPAQSSVPASTQQPAVTPAEGAEASETKPGEAGLSAEKAASVPKTPAEETGDKVGNMVTKVLENNPELQTKVDQMNLDHFLENPGAMGNRVKASVQKSKLFKLIPKRMDKHIAGMFPADMEQNVREALAWLRTPVDPMALNSSPAGDTFSPSSKKSNVLEQAEAGPSSPGSLADSLGGDSLSGKTDPMIAEDPAAGKGLDSMSSDSVEESPKKERRFLKLPSLKRKKDEDPLASADLDSLLGAGA